MYCVSKFVVLVNGGSSGFFKVSRGIRQGCPLSLFLFLLVAEALSLLVPQAKGENKIRGLSVTSQNTLTQLLFVDDVLLVGLGSVDEWVVFKDILNLFCLAIGMQIRIQKSMLLKHNISHETEVLLSLVLPYSFEELENGFKYLGYFLKPNYY